MLGKFILEELISTHTPLAGRDIIQQDDVPIIVDFYSHAPRGT